MKLNFDTNIAETLGLNEAIFLNWLSQHYDRTPTKIDNLLDIFKFWSDETLHQCLANLETQKFIFVQRTPHGDCIFNINGQQIQTRFGVAMTHSTTPDTQVLIDNNLKKHLLRFQSSDTLLNKKLTQLLQQDTQDLLEYGLSEGLSKEVVTVSFDKFLHYVSANPDRFWNTDLIAYWRFWISNTKDKQGTTGGQNFTQGGKRSAIERSNEHAASNWLKKKTTDSLPPTSSVQISHSNIKKPT